MDDQHTYISKVESGKLDFTLYPDEFLVGKLTIALDADDTELPLAKKVPTLICGRFCNTRRLLQTRLPGRRRAGRGHPSE